MADRWAARALYELQATASDSNHCLDYRPSAEQFNEQQKQ